MDRRSDDHTERRSYGQTVRGSDVQTAKRQDGLRIFNTTYEDLNRSRGVSKDASRGASRGAPTGAPRYVSCQSYLELLTENDLRTPEKGRTGYEKVREGMKGYKKV